MINFDCETDDELWAYWRRWRVSLNFSNRMLAEYCTNLYTARALRLKGNVERALVYERANEEIYNRLPSWVKW